MAPPIVDSAANRRDGGVDVAEEAQPEIEDLTDFVRIGTGGFSAVYSALDVTFQRRVAVKVLARLSADHQRRFERELRITGQLSSHPNVVTPFRAGFTPYGAPYLVMEYVAGGSLADLVVGSGPVPWRRAVSFMVGVADALAHAHGQSVLHRDVKPANIPRRPG